MTKQKFNTSVADPGRNRKSTQRRDANSFGHFFYIKMKIGKAETGACVSHPYGPPMLIIIIINAHKYWDIFNNPSWISEYVYVGQSIVLPWSHYIQNKEYTFFSLLNKIIQNVHITNIIQVSILYKYTFINESSKSIMVATIVNKKVVNILVY